MNMIRNLFQRKKNALNREQSLNAIPVCNEKVETEWDEDTGELLILIPRRNDWLVRCLTKVFYVPQYKKISLDALGAYVWKLCDGKRSVRDLITEFAKKYKLSRKEAELSLIAFLRQMAKKRLIALAIIEHPSGPAPRSSSVEKRKRSRAKKAQRV